MRRSDLTYSDHAEYEQRLPALSLGDPKTGIEMVSTVVHTLSLYRIGVCAVKRHSFFRGASTRGGGTACEWP